MIEMNTKKNIDLVIGTRPNIIKAAPLYKALAASDWAVPRLVFLQQHTDPALSTQTMEDVGISQSQVTTIPLQGDHYGDRLGCMVSRYADLLGEGKPDLVTVFGDVDTTLAAAIAAKREHCLLAHVEAGLRSHDRKMPEELNRLMVDSIADLHLTTTAEARDTLLREGHPESSVHFVGNLMIDSLLATADADLGQQVCERYGLVPDDFILATFHRPSNVDALQGLMELAQMLEDLARDRRVLFPLHPRTRDSMSTFGVSEHFNRIGNLVLSPPLRYKEFVSVQSLASAIFTDSGGIQEESSVLGITCLTVRDSTERPVTLGHRNELVTALDAVARLNSQSANDQPAEPIALWDGKAASRITRVLKSLVDY